MNSIKLLQGFVRKELSMEGNFGIRLLTKLIIGPLISACTAGILYAGFFSANNQLELGTLNQENFKPFLLIGFLFHSILNSGYYSISNKLLTEKWMNTLPLLWLSPCPPWLALFGMILTEAFRCLALTVMSLIYFYSVIPFSWGLLLILCTALALLFLAGCILGLGRFLWGLVHQGKTEFPDQLYLVLIFTSCFYIPKDLLPQFIGPFVSLNPLYQLNHSLRFLWLGKTISIFTSFIIPIIILLSVALGLLLVWKKMKSLIIENSFA